MTCAIDVRPNAGDSTSAGAETERLTLRPMGADGAEFIVQLLNEPAFVRYVCDKGVRTKVDALRSITEGPVSSGAATCD